MLCLFLGTRILESKKTAAPAFSFGARHMNKNSTYGPGPAQYNITGLAAKGRDTPPQISLQSRAKAVKVIETPAPGEYHIEKSDKYVVSAAPKFTFGVKKYCGITNYETPGEITKSYQINLHNKLKINHNHSTTLQAVK